jgi:hypothetical protein
MANFRFSTLWFAVSALTLAALTAAAIVMTASAASGRDAGKAWGTITSSGYFQ